MRSGLGGLRQCRVDHFARRVHVDTSESLRRREHAPDPTAQELAGRGLVAVDRPGHREHGHPIDLVDGSTHQTRRVPGPGPPPHLSGTVAPLGPWSTLADSSANVGTVDTRPDGSPPHFAVRRFVVRPLPSLGQRDGRVRAGADVAPLSLGMEPLNAALVHPARPARGHDQVHRVQVHRVARVIPARPPHWLSFIESAPFARACDTHGTPGTPTVMPRIGPVPDRPGSQEGKFFIICAWKSACVDRCEPTRNQHQRYGSAKTKMLLPLLGRSSGVRRMLSRELSDEPVLATTYCLPSTA